MNATLTLSSAFLATPPTSLQKDVSSRSLGRRPVFTPPVDSVVYSSPLKNMPNEARKPLCDYIIQQSETDGENPPWVMALLDHMDVAEDAGHGAELIEPDDADAEKVEVNPIRAQRQIECTARGKETAPDITVTEVTPAPAGQSPIEDDTVFIASPSKQMPKQSHSPSKPFRILVPTPEEVHRVDTDLGLTPLGTWPTFLYSLTIPQQIAFLDKYIACFEDDQLEIHAAGQEEIEFAMTQAKRFEAEARMHEALGKKARDEGEAKTAMWRAKKREAGIKRRKCLFEVMRRVLEMQMENEEARKKKVAGKREDDL